MNQNKKRAISCILANTQTKINRKYMATSFTDCCIRYGQESVYTRFSEGNMTLGEIYMSLAYGLIDPTCLPAMAIIHYDNKIWCTDTRRLTLAKELEKRGKFDILKLMNIREVKKNTRQYVDFVNHRLPAMQRNGLDGLDIKVSDRRGPTCCFDTNNRFRIDLEEHVIRDHLNNFTLELFKNLTIYPCNICQTTTRITCTKSTTRSYYTIIRKCGCKPAKPHRFTQPWSTLTFIDMCNELHRYNHSLKRKVFIQNPTTPSNHTIATQTDVIDKPSTYAFDPQSPSYKPRTPPSQSIATQTDFIDKPSKHESDFPKIPYIHSSQLTIFDLKCPPTTAYAQNQPSQQSRLHPATLLTMKKYRTKPNMNIIDDHKCHNKSKNRSDRHHQQTPKSCCNIS